jgi:hypothetical protein
VKNNSVVQAKALFIPAVNTGYPGVRALNVPLVLNQGVRSRLHCLRLSMWELLDISCLILRIGQCMKKASVEGGFSLIPCSGTWKAKWV